ncbi:MAG: helix-turn-helix domain-containing protein [Vicinamibacterales bacterium]
MKSRDDKTAGDSSSPATDDGVLFADDVLTAYVRPLREIEEEHVQFALRACNGNKKRAAAALGISRDTLYRKLADFEERLLHAGASMSADAERLR